MKQPPLKPQDEVYFVSALQFDTPYDEACLVPALQVMNAHDEA